MGKIYCLMGKSATGKDTIYKALMARSKGKIRTIVPYTTRPVRDGETEGVEYHFLTVPEYKKLKEEGKIIESRCYQTVYGEWYYFTVNDGQIDLSKNDYLLIMTLEGYENLKKYFGNDSVLPIYIEVEPGLRLSRALEREKKQKSPKYAEMCRRFLADEEDFSEEKLDALKIIKRYQNEDLEQCVGEIASDVDIFGKRYGY